MKSPGSISDAPLPAEVAAEALEQPPRPPGAYGVAAGIVTVVGTIYLLREFAALFQQLLVAFFLSSMIMPVHHGLIRRGLPGLASGILIVAALAATFTGVGALVGNSFSDLETKLPRYQASLGNMLEQATARFPALEAPLRSITEAETDRGLHIIQAALQALSDFLSQTFLVIIYLLFILAERAGFDARLERSFSPETARKIEEGIRTINASIAQYIVVKTIMGLAAGVLTTVILLACGVDYAALWGILTFLFNYIPYLGSIVATIAPVLLSLVQFQDPAKTVAILVVLLVIQNAIGYFIEPRIAGRTLDLSPLVIIISLAFWGSLWGIVGMVLAVPLVVLVRAILANSPATRPLARMLSNA